jgi:hypothetical protein
VTVRIDLSVVMSLDQMMALRSPVAGLRAIGAGGEGDRLLPWLTTRALLMRPGMRGSPGCHATWLHSLVR